MWELQEKSKDECLGIIGSEIEHICNFNHWKYQRAKWTVSLAGHLSSEHKSQFNPNSLTLNDDAITKI